MANGARTRDPRDHNAVLYQLSYSHRVPDEQATTQVYYRPGVNDETTVAAVVRAKLLEGPGSATNTASR